MAKKGVQTQGRGRDGIGNEHGCYGASCRNEQSESPAGNKKEIETKVGSSWNYLGRRSRR
jgi:hypothetical protein